MYDSDDEGTRTIQRCLPKTWFANNNVTVRGVATSAADLLGGTTADFNGTNGWTSETIRAEESRRIGERRTGMSYGLHSTIIRSLRPISEIVICYKENNECITRPDLRLVTSLNKKAWPLVRIPSLYIKRHVSSRRTGHRSNPIWCNSLRHRYFCIVAVQHSHSGKISLADFQKFGAAESWVFLEFSLYFWIGNYQFYLLVTTLWLYLLRPAEEHSMPWVLLMCLPFGDGSIRWYEGWVLTGMERVLRKLKYK